MSEIQDKAGKVCSRWSFAAIEHVLKRKIARQRERELYSVAAKSWEIAPGETSVTPPAFFLPNQLERVTGWEFYPNEHPRRTMEGGITTVHSSTKGFLLKDVWLIDGTFYKDNASSFMSARSRLLPRIHVDREVDRGAVFCTAGGNKWFGSWLADDCLIYSLASAEGLPVTTSHSLDFHKRGYEEAFGMQPLRISNAFFREFVIFEDLGQNRNRHMRFRTLSDKLLSRVNASAHPGVFILRGGSGEKRLLHNERELAEYLRDRRGFRILDPEKCDVPTIVAACAGARTIISVEGSQLIHGFLALQPGCSILTLQPPNRFVCIYKYRADREHVNFGFVVGIAEGNGFRIDPEEVERTLDLFPE